MQREIYLITIQFSCIIQGPTHPLKVIEMKMIT